jgi:hypothetical protein
MNSIEPLVATLEECIPLLDPAPLLANPPESMEEYSVLDWLFEHLEAQELMEYFEWKEYFGEIPNLKPLQSLDLSECDTDFVFGLIQEMESFPAHIDMPYELPFLEFINDTLKKHGLCLLTLAYENAYVFCARDDDALLEKLDARLGELGISLIQPGAMNREEVKAFLSNPE